MVRGVGVFGAGGMGGKSGMSICSFSLFKQIQSVSAPFLHTIVSLMIGNL